MTRLTYHASVSEPGDHHFSLELSEIDEEIANYTATVRAWFALGYDEIGDEKLLSSYKRAKLGIAHAVALETECLRAAYDSKEVRWLIAQDAEFVIAPYSWAIYSEDCSADIEIADDSVAMLFKLTFGGA